MKQRDSGAKSWIAPAVGAALFLALGVAMLIWPDFVIGFFPPLVGVVMLLVGIQATAYHLVMWRRVAAPGFGLLRGVVSLVVGVIFITKQDLSLAFLSILFGVYVLVTAAINFTAAIRLLRAKKPFVADLADSLFNLILGGLLLASPFSGRALWVRVLGLFFIVSAGSTILWLWRQRRAEAGHSGPEPEKLPPTDEDPTKPV